MRLLVDSSVESFRKLVKSIMKKIYKFLLFLVISLNTVFVCVNIVLIVWKPFEPLDESEKLLLTPQIKLNTEESQKLAKVHHSKFFYVQSYSGYLTVDESTESHMFFWYFPAEKTPNSPLILWLNGDPGTSLMYGVFAEIGPFYILPSGELSIRRHSWHKQYNLLFIDNPVGTGFSHTVNGHITNQMEGGKHLYTALRQFYQIFPDLVNRDFYIAGETMAGRYIPALSHTIHINNQKSKQKINMKGLMIANGWSDPINQINYADYLYQHGLLDMHEADVFRMAEDTCINLIAKQKYLEAYNVFSDIIYGDLDYTPNGSLFANFTGLTNFYNVLKSDGDDPMEVYIEQFVNQNDIKRALHVGDAEFQLKSKTVARKLTADNMRSVAMWVSELLSHYKVLLFHGQLDILSNPSAVDNYIMSMNFSSSEEFGRTPKKRWYVGNDLAGYVRVAGNLTEIMVKNAGHMIMKDQPLWCLDMIDRLIHDKSFN